MDLDELKKEKEKFTTRVFWLGLQVAFIFGIPAALGAILGTHLDKIYSTGKKITSVILFFTFIFSWIITIQRYQRINKEIKNIDRQIKEKKEKALEI